MRVYEQPRPGGGTRILILGSSAYVHAQTAKLKVPRLTQISSAAESALRLATEVLSGWEDDLPKPLASVDILVDTPQAPAGVKYTRPDGTEFDLEPPTMENVKAARKAWMKDASGNDVLIFYCCGHGIWLPARGRTFLTASFGRDEDDPWSDAIALTDFASALAEYPPRQQWLIFDCCNNTPTQALRQANANAAPLLSSTEGQRKAAVDNYGSLSQVILASASMGALAFGKVGRPSRFMEAFLEACQGAGCRKKVGGKWWVDQQGIEEAMETYPLRVAPIEEQDYFTFTRVTETDAPGVPRLLGRTETPKCTLLIHSLPPHRLKQAALTVRAKITAQIVARQDAGPAALPRLKVSVRPWLDYDLEAYFEGQPPLTVTKEVFALPPFAVTVF
jgi:hypothetical protein